MTVMSDRQVTYVYVSSSVASPNDPSYVSLTIPRGAIDCGVDNFLRLSLAQMSMQNNIYNIRNGANQVTIAGTTYTIEPGFYKMYDLATYMNSLQSFVTFAFLPRQNKYRVTKISLAGTVTISFQSNLNLVFGFANSIVVTATPITSTSCVTPCTVTDLVIRMSDVLVDPPTNLATVGGPLLNASSIFAIVPMRARPGCVNVFHNNNNAYTIDIFDTDPDKLTLSITDSSGRAIDGLSHWSAVIKVERMERPSLSHKTFLLQNICEYIRLIFLQSALKDGRNDQFEAAQFLQESSYIDQR